MSGFSDMGKHEPQPICVVILTDQSEAEGTEAFSPLNTIERTQGLQPRGLLLPKHQSPRQWVPHVWILRHGKARAPSGRIVILRTGAPGAPWTTQVVHGGSRAKDLLPAKHQSPRPWVPHVWILRHGKARTPTNMRCHPDRPKRSGGNRGLQASEHDRTYAGASAPGPASPEASIPTTMGAPCLDSQTWESTRTRGANCHPETRRAGGPVDDTSRPRGKPGEGSASREASIRTTMGAPSW